MEICKRCNGTGYEGNCDICGGSGFVTPTKEKTDGTFWAHRLDNRFVKIPGKHYNTSSPAQAPKPVNVAKSPALPAAQRSAVSGIPANNLCFPDSVRKLGWGIIATQIYLLQSRYGHIRSITWHSPSECTVVTTDGCFYREIFRLSQGTFLLDSQVRPKPFRRIAPKVKRPKEDTAKQKGTKHGDKGKQKHGRPKTGVEKQTDRMLGSKQSKPLKQTAFELAFELAETEQEHDGSRGWHSLRESGSGQFGSHPSFDPSDGHEE